MSLEEIKTAIAQLPDEKRRDLVGSIVPRFVELTAEDEARIQAEFEAVPDDGWIDWEDLKAQTGGFPTGRSVLWWTGNTKQFG